MTIKQKFERIDQSKLEPKQVDALKIVLDFTENFKTKDKDKIKITNEKLDNIIVKLQEKNPDAVKPIPSPKTSAKTPTKKVVKPKTPKRNIFSVAKEIKKEGETFEEAKKRASMLIKQEKEEANKTIKTEMQSLLEYIKLHKELKGISGTDLGRDSKRLAKVGGVRTVTRSGSTTNQYGTFDNKLGRRYSENRENRKDRLAPNYPKNAPLLAKGGGLNKVMWQDMEIGDSARVKETNRMGLIIKNYGRKFHLRFPNGTEKTFDASDLEFFKLEKDEYEMAEGGSTEKYKVGQKFYDTRYDRVCEIVPSRYDGLVTWKRYNKSGTEFENDTQHSLVENQFDYLVNMGAYQISKQSMANGGEFMTDPTFGNFQNQVYEDGGSIDGKKITVAKKLKVKNWYLKTYPTDDLGEEINPDIDFWLLWKYMTQGYNVYNVLGVGDSLIRERVFQKLSEILGIDYDVIYNKWLHSDTYEFGGDFQSGVYAKGGLLKPMERYLLEIKGLTGLRVTAIESYIEENDLSNDDVLNIVIGLGRKQLKGSDVATAVVGKKGNSQSKKLIAFAKNNEGMKMAEGGDLKNFSDNQLMIINQNIELERHHEALEDILEDKTDVPAWVVAKIATATESISDVTHYLDGEKELLEDEEEDEEEKEESKDEDEDEDEDEVTVEPMSVSSGAKSNSVRDFSEEALGNLKGFLKGKEGIELQEDYTFSYGGKNFEIEPMMNSDEKGISNALFTVYNDNNEEVGEIIYTREGGKQKFRANSIFFKWNNTKFANGGGIRSQSELKNIFSEKQNLVKNLTPKQIAEMWNKNSYGVKEGISKPMTIEEAKNSTTRMYLENLLIENELTEDEQSKYFANGGAFAPNVSDGTQFMGGVYAYGGITYFNDENKYRLGRASSIGTFEPEIFNKVKDRINEDDFVGNFGWKIGKSRGAGAYLYKLNDYDQNLVKKLKLKQGDKIFRYVSRTTAIGGMMPFIKINVENGLLYFSMPNDDDKIVFETRGIKPMYLNLIEGSFANGGEFMTDPNFGNFQNQVYADGGELNGQETINLKSYNIHGQLLDSGKIVVDYDDSTIQFPSGKTLKVVPDREFTYRFQKTQIKASQGIRGLVEFLKEINNEKSPFNPSVTSLFIDFGKDGKYANGGSLPFMTDPNFGNFQNQVYAYGGKTKSQPTMRDLWIETISSRTATSKEAVRNFVDENNLSDNQLGALGQGIGRGMITDEFVSALVGKKGNSSTKKVIEFTNSRKAYQMADGGEFMTDPNFGNFQNQVYARGGYVSKGELVWRNLSDSDRSNFLYENFTPEITPRSQELLVRKDFNFLPKNVKIKMEAKYANVEDYAKGGDLKNFSDNQLMIMNQNVQLEHHHEELNDILEDKTDVPAWVVVKMATANESISEVTYYLDKENDILEVENEEKDEDEDEVTVEPMSVEPMTVSNVSKADIIKDFSEDALGNLKGFLKGKEGIELEEDYTFSYEGKNFEIEPVINTDEKGVSNALFTVYNDDEEQVGEIIYTRGGGKQNFIANSKFFKWNNTKFAEGGMVDSFIPNVGTIDTFMLKSLLVKNPKVKSTLGVKEFEFLKNKDTDCIGVSSKPYNVIVTDGNKEFELDMKKWTLVKPLSQARDKIKSHYSENYAKGGEIAKAEILGLKRNIMGTTDIEMKITGMRKPQSFIVYPISKDDSGDIITIQSETRIGKIDLSTGRGLMSQSHSNGAYFVHFQIDKKTPFVLSDNDLKDLKEHINKTSGAMVGTRGIVTDNSGASKVFAKGGIIITKIEEIPNLRQKVDKGQVTYRGLGLGKLANDFYKVAGQNGTRIKVDGQEYFITDDDFRELDWDFKNNKWMNKINFRASARKFESGGVVYEEAIFKMNKDLQNSSQVKRIADYHKKSIQQIVRALQSKITVLKYEDGSVKLVSIDYTDPDSKVKVHISETYGKYELGGEIVADLAGHTGGSLGTDTPSLLVSDSGTRYTGIVGETGAMSAGEMFARGGAVGDNVLGLKKGDIYKIIDTQHTASSEVFTFIDYVDKDNHIMLKSLTFPPNPKKKNDFVYVYEISSDGVKVLNDEEIGQVITRRYKNFIENNYELGGEIVADLAGHTGGSLGTDTPSLLVSDSGTRYTGIVGETGAMSAGEMFEMGGGLPAGAEQRYVDYYLNPSPILAEGGSLEAHGIEEGDTFIKTISGNIQKVKDKNGNIVFINLSTGERDSQPPLPFKKGGSVDYKYLNHSQDYEVIYGEGKNRHGYGNVEYAEGGNVEFSEKRKEYLEKLGNLEAEVWDKIGAFSGGLIRKDKTLLKEYALGVSKIMETEGIGYGSFDQQDYDFYTDENWHLFNEFLVWNNYYEPEMTKVEKAWRKKAFEKDPKHNYISNPEVITLNSTKRTNEQEASSSSFKPTVEFNVGDVVWQKSEKMYGVVMDNYGNKKEGSSGDIRLDSTGNTNIFEYDKNYENTGYNLVKFGSSEDAGDGDVQDIKDSANRLIKSQIEYKDKEKEKYYREIFKRVLAGEFDKKTKSNLNRHGFNVKIEEVSATENGKNKLLYGANVFLKDNLIRFFPAVSEDRKKLEDSIESWFKSLKSWEKNNPQSRKSGDFVVFYNQRGDEAKMTFDNKKDAYDFYDALKKVEADNIIVSEAPIAKYIPNLTKKYIPHYEIKSVKVKKGGKEVTYDAKDVLNGANMLKGGGELEKNASYISKYNVIHVELKDGTYVKPSNGYWVKKGAIPIDKMEDGGKIDNQYEDRSADEVWKDWSYDQKYHFLTDHREKIGFEEDLYSESKRTTRQKKSSMGTDIGFMYNDIDKIINTKYTELPAYVKRALLDHVRGGQYKEGGKIEDFKIGDFVKRTKKEGNITHGTQGFIYEIDKLFSEIYLEDEYGNKISKPYKIEGFRKLKSKSRYDEGGKVEEVVINKDGIKVKSVAQPKKKLTEAEWLAKYSESKEARSYKAGGDLSKYSQFIQDEFPASKRLANKFAKKYNLPFLVLVEKGNDDTIYLKEANGFYAFPKSYIDAHDVLYVTADKMAEGGLTFDEKSSGTAVRFDLYGYKKASNRVQDLDIIIKANSYEEAEKIAKKYLSDDNLELVELYTKEGFVGSIRPNGKFIYSSRYKKEKFAQGGVTFDEKSTSIAKKFVGKDVEPKYQKEYGKVYSKSEAKEVGDKIAGSMVAKDKMKKGGITNRGGIMLLAKQIRNEAESWKDALKRAGDELKK